MGAGPVGEAAAHGRVDWFRLCHYLAAAPDPAHSKAFVVPQPASDHLSVLATLRLCEEPPDEPDNHSPVRTALRYLGNRTDQLDYARALGLDLPSAPASSASGHRHVLHARIKKAGTQWIEAKLHGLR